MSSQIDVDRVLVPLEETSRTYYVLLALGLLGALITVLTFAYQLRVGIMNTTDLGDWGISGSIPWGLYVGAFVWWVGVAHGGIAISAMVRVFGMERYRPIARLSEMLTILALVMSAFNIIISMGRPDRIFNTIKYWPYTVFHSPLAWDIAVISLYLVLSLTYAVLSLRSDIYRVRDRLPWIFGPIYSLILFGYTPEEEEKVEQILWWLAVAILSLVPLLSGGVVPWLFSLIPAQPHWYGAGAGAAILTESITSALAVVLIVAASFRYAYGWEDMIDDRIFKDLGIMLALLAIATIWFTMHDVLTGYYIAPVHIEELIHAELHRLSFWAAVGGLIFSVVVVFTMIARPDLYNLPALVVVAVVLAVSILIKKEFFVIEALLHPTRPPLSNLYPTGTYSPTWVEWVLFGGSVLMVGLGFLILSKVIPLVELDVEGDEA
ncbi:MAG: NrfD/PsrC family molybdoenzyme membrane anchor subunit [Halodesulfurarchaeum sp.]